MALTVRFLVIAVLALLPATVSAAEPKPAEPSKEMVAAFKKLGFNDTLYGIKKDGQRELFFERRSDPNDYLSILPEFTTGSDFKVEYLKLLPAAEVPYALILDKYDITDSDVKALAAQKNLVELTLSASKVTAASFPDVAKCKQLRSLKILGIPLKDDDLKALTPLADLTDLMVIGSLTKDCATSLKQFKKLSRLNVGLTFPALKAKDLGELKQLVELNVNWDDEDLKSAKDFPKLRSLSSFKCTDAGLRELAGHKSLQDLRLNHSKITDAGMADIRSLPELLELQLFSTGITDAGLKALAGAPKLTKLDLESTKVSDPGLKDLAAFKNLTVLIIRGTAITKDGAAKLEKSLPNCKIIGP